MNKTDHPENIDKPDRGISRRLIAIQSFFYEKNHLPILCNLVSLVKV